MSTLLRQLPQVDALLGSPRILGLISLYSRQEVADSLRAALEALRIDVKAGHLRELPDFEGGDFAAGLAGAIVAGRRPNLRPAINAAGGAGTGERNRASGWVRDGAVQDQIEDSIRDELSAARARLPSGAGLEECEDCDETIPPARRKALIGARTCVACQSERDKQPRFSAINRRGSKDSQLR